MIIDLKKSKSKKDQDIESYFKKKKSKARHENELLEGPHDLMLKEHFQNSLFSWRAPEFEKNEWDNKWYLAASIIIAAIVIYALVNNSPIMAITFVLIGIVGFIFLQKDPRTVNFAITHEGIVADKEVYEFRNIQSFWIFYEPFMKVVSLRMKGRLMPHIHIPIHNQSPAKMREVLLQFIPEIEQDLTLVDVFERMLRL